MSGSEQFLGRQLTKQAESLGLLVEKMTEAVQGIHNAVPKFAIASDEVKKRKIFDNTEMVANNSKLETMTVFLSGTIRLVLVAKSSNGHSFLAVNKNGVQVAKSAEPTVVGVGFKRLYCDVAVVEGDELEVVLYPSGGIGTFINIDKYEICYTLVDKPDIANTLEGVENIG